jgi:hypothetical protein
LYFIICQAAQLNEVNHHVAQVFPCGHVSHLGPVAQVSHFGHVFPITHCIHCAHVAQVFPCGHIFPITHCAHCIHCAHVAQVVPCGHVSHLGPVAPSEHIIVDHNKLSTHGVYCKL